MNEFEPGLLKIAAAVVIVKVTPPSQARRASIVRAAVANHLLLWRIAPRANQIAVIAGSPLQRE